MLKQHKFKIASAAVLSALIAFETVGTAAAVPLPIREAAPSYSKLQAESVAYKRKWIRQRDGNRYRYKRHGYHHYHNGYWYHTPWWGVGIGLGLGAIGAATANNHVAYCSSKYNSYNPATDMYLGYDGAYHRCVTP